MDKAPSLDLSFLPPVFVLDSHISPDQLHALEENLIQSGAILTYDVKEAKLFVGNIKTARRAKLELQWKGVHVVETGHVIIEDEVTPKRRKLKHASDGRASSTSGQASSEIHGDHLEETGSQSISQLSIEKQGKWKPLGLDLPENQVVFARLEWLQECLKSKQCLALSGFVVLCGQVKFSDDSEKNEASKAHPIPLLENQHDLSEKPKEILARAKGDDKDQKAPFSRRDRVQRAADKDFRDRTFAPSHNKTTENGRRPPHLVHQTTSEHENSEAESVPPLPDWVINGRIYACQRPTPANPPNSDFINQLKQIKTARLLSSDEIGVRAYSTSIAALAAYPHLIRGSKEILVLPGCDQKIAHLFNEYKTSGGHIQAVEDVKADPVLKILQEFYDVWGVGAKTARELYYDKGFKDLDDIIELGWQSLTRVQQIGVKYYDEFLLKIPRSEVESIAATISVHAKRLTDCNLQTILVGGYRRGKSESGDVDVVLSHPNQDLTLDLVSLVVKSLEKDGWITHTLTLNLTNSKRGQDPLPVRTSAMASHGFDTLDKALVVWQDPDWAAKASDLAQDPGAKNPNPHRRVDIIISPWKTVGCAVAGWTSGTTFQRDLRRYVKKEKGFKFDSSGVRDRATGNWIDLEGWTNEATRCVDWKEAERRVFEGLGLEYFDPWERCTG